MEVKAHVPWEKGIIDLFKKSGSSEQANGSFQETRRQTGPGTKFQFSIKKNKNTNKIK